MTWGMANYLSEPERLRDGQAPSICQRSKGRFRNHLDTITDITLGHKKMSML